MNKDWEYWKECYDTMLDACEDTATRLANCQSAYLRTTQALVEISRILGSGLTPSLQRRHIKELIEKFEFLQLECK